jgi:hypothetical protein
VSIFLLDSDHLTLYQMGHPQLLQNVVRHLADESTQNHSGLAG